MTLCLELPFFKRVDISTYTCLGQVFGQSNLDSVVKKKQVTLYHNLVVVTVSPLFVSYIVVRKPASAESVEAGEDSFSCLRIRRFRSSKLLSVLYFLTKNAAQNISKILRFQGSSFRDDDIGLLPTFCSSLC